MVPGSTGAATPSDAASAGAEVMAGTAGTAAAATLEARVPALGTCTGGRRVRWFGRVWAARVAAIWADLAAVVIRAADTGVAVTTAKTEIWKGPA